MSLLRYFQPRLSLPTPQQTGIGERATAEANAAVTEVIGDSGPSNGRKRKRYTAFSDKDRAAIGRHAAENSNVSALKKFRSSFPDLGESTVRLFRRKYLETVKQRAAQGDSSRITSIPSKRMSTIKENG